MGVSKRVFVPGPPKQFAALIGALFAGVAAVLGLVIEPEGGEHIAACVVIAVLMFCAFLEVCCNITAPLEVIAVGSEPVASLWSD
jgi:hypothetical protein